MTEQNIYDNPEFFEGYKEIRDNPNSYNSIIEKPNLFKLCPDFTGKTVLDLGCGYGENCAKFSELGAKEVVGIDISANMLKTARDENKYKNVSFINMSMIDLNKLDKKFDIVISSLAFHYIKDFKSLLNNIYEVLNENGILIFSQSHPIVTAFMTGKRWTNDENGNPVHYNLSDYNVLGERKITWIVDEVVIYHRNFAETMTH